MKICFLAPANSAHIQKWSGYFVSRGHEVHVVSFTPGELPGAAVHRIDCGADGESSDAKKLRYLLKAGAVRRAIRALKPDIINAHYATSYGAVAALAGLPNYVLSVWGSDIYEFPNKSPLHKALLQMSLNTAPHLFSTSRAMAAEAGKYTKKTFSITPFGVDTELFTPAKRERTDGDFVIGTVKALDDKYGIDLLLKAAARLHREHAEIPLRLRIAGRGPAEAKLRQLAVDCGIADLTSFLGFIPQEQAAWEWANMDLAVIPSVANESFGVSAVEAQSCACPVLISNVPGLMEATSPGRSSVVVPRGDADALAAAILSLWREPERRKALGRAGREYVEEQYAYQRCFERIEALYEGIIAEK